MNWKRFWRIVSWIRWLLPLLMVWVGSYIPVMRTPISMPTSNLLWMLLFVSLLLLVFWLVAEVVTVTDRNTSVLNLQWDDVMSLLIAVAVTGVAFRNAVHWWWPEWWYFFPWLGALLDAALSGYLAINNAAQKPLVTQQK